jgi:pyruvate,water dikinase
MRNRYDFSTGLPNLDKALQGVRAGDNIVLQVDAIDDYFPFVHPFCLEAIKRKQRLIYFRFAGHPQVVPDKIDAEVYNLHPENGFETFISEIFDVIEKRGRGACFVFDSLSELVADWYSDRMLGNFFMLTCPYLYDYDTVTYFALLRDQHTDIATKAIHNTAQVVLDVYNNKNKLYLHPKKVDKRYSPTLYMLHIWEGDDFLPAVRSSVISEVTTSIPQPWLDFTSHRSDFWGRTFSQAQEYITNMQQGEESSDKVKKLLKRLIRMAVTRDPKVLKLAEKYFDIADLVGIGKRMIGTGLIGGKSTGMMLARAVLHKSRQRWEDLLEPHDSFFIGSDVFYTYIIQNGCWWMRRKLLTSDDFLSGADEVRQKLLRGTFPDEIKAQFMKILEYFGQAPIIVRSSSLLEDGYGNAFSGKYDSVFCANQGTPKERLDNFIDAVCTIYASTMKKETLAYRKHLGLLDRDEQMALLVQRVSGSRYDDLFFPQLGGVGLSFNPFVWNKDIDPQAGMLRFVYGLGTRAVDRNDDDYTRIIALNAPNMMPESSMDSIRKHTQKNVDVINIEANKFDTLSFEELVKVTSDLDLDMFATRDTGMEQRARAHNIKDVFSHVLTFDKILSKTDFVEDMKELLYILQEAYNYPVDIEFTLNFLPGGSYKINLVQCRPFQAKSKISKIKAPEDLEQSDVVFSTSGPIIGNSVSIKIDRLIYVEPGPYSKLNMADRYTVAKVIGELTHLNTNNDKKVNIAIMGPGRWGTSTPSLGVPVSLSDINTVSVIVEIAAMHDGLVPEVSLGTHFFNDLVDLDMLYMAIYPEKEGHIINTDYLGKAANKLETLLPGKARWGDVIKVIEVDKVSKGKSIHLNAHSIGQKGICYLRY